MLGNRVVGIGHEDSQGIAEDGRRFVETDAVLSDVRRCFLGVPFEEVSHSSTTPRIARARRLTPTGRRRVRRRALAVEIPFAAFVQIPPLRLDNRFAWCPPVSHEKVFGDHL